ncbi:hypothetical protein BD779DRAFT_1467712 [Infundibulicybe gibba]|nr:hypothetical protein BD779DRAFT_1467712 [Infundibulicybe gibba]
MGAAWVVAPTLRALPASRHSIPPKPQECLKYLNTRHAYSRLSDAVQHEEAWERERSAREPEDLKVVDVQNQYGQGKESRPQWYPQTPSWLHTLELPLLHWCLRANVVARAKCWIGPSKSLGKCHGGEAAIRNTDTAAAKIADFISTAQMVSSIGGYKYVLGGRTSAGGGEGPYPSPLHMGNCRWESTPKDVQSVSQIFGLTPRAFDIVHCSPTPKKSDVAARILVLSKIMIPGTIYIIELGIGRCARKEIEHSKRAMTMVPPYHSTDVVGDAVGGGDVGSGSVVVVEVAIGRHVEKSAEKDYDEFIA